jgi:peptidoglycan/LPS O-acetylase OafA/YrhL
MKAFKINTITKNDTLLLKAIGIILIVFHNYFRWIKPITGENEFGMSPGYLLKSFRILSFNPMEIINVFFNFFGHYGVQIFIFISAYGLTKAYANKSFTWKGFVVKRFYKLYPSLLIATFAMIVFNIAAHGNLPSKNLLIELGSQLSLLSTLIPGKALSAVGPWWFYSMIFQFYLLFPLLLWVNNRFRAKGLILIAILSYVLLIIFNPVLLKFKLNILNTAIGHLPEFCFGIWLAGKKDFKVHFAVYLVALSVFILGNYFKPVWYFSHLAAMIVLLPILQFVISKIKQNDFISKIILFVGVTSVYLFAVHGFLRWEFVGLANFLNYPLTEFLVAILFFLFSLGFAHLLNLLEKQMRTWVRSNEGRKNQSYRVLFLFVLMAGLVLSVKSCESINYAKKKKLKEVVGNKHLIDFEKNEDMNLVIVDTVAFSGKKSCLITPKKEFGPEYRFLIKDVKIEKIKEIKVGCFIYNNLSSYKDIHVVFDIRKNSGGASVNWTNQHFTNETNNDLWIGNKMSFEIDGGDARPDSYAKIYVWNNSEESIIIDDFSVEIVYYE